MIVARRFIAGSGTKRPCVPEGRLNSERGRVEIFALNLSDTPNSKLPRSDFKRPSGTQISWMANPAINRRATIACPSGTK
jgi:hypothetical protein